MSETKEAKLLSKSPIYSTIDYPTCHFSLADGSLTEGQEDWFVAVVQYKKGPYYLIKVNPTDARGLRSIVRLISQRKSEMKETLNRPYTLQEKQGLAHVLALVSHIYEQELGLVAQVEIAGNNAHDFKDGHMILGKPTEPIMCHGHVVGRGDPHYAYITELPDLKLGGQRPGEPFNGRGNSTSGDIGNMFKVAWPSITHLKTFAKILSSYICQAISDARDKSDLELVRARI